MESIEKIKNYRDTEAELKIIIFFLKTKIFIFDFIQH